MNTFHNHKSHRKGQIELSANFIIVIIISIIIVVGGLVMFFKMKNNAQSIVTTLDSQTQDRIKSMMLSGTEHVAVYPSDPTIGTGDSQLIGVGVTNNFDVETNFTVDVIKVERYIKDAAVGVSLATSTNMANYRDINSPKLKLAPHSQEVKSILIKMPDSIKGQYVYTIQINNTIPRTLTTPQTTSQYGIVQVYANNP